MVFSVIVMNSIIAEDSKLRVGFDMELGGNLNVEGSVTARSQPAGFEGEIKMFLASVCPQYWEEATELNGYFLQGRPEGGQVNQTHNRPMGANETGRMHNTYWKGGHVVNGAYDERYMGGYYDSFGTSGTSNQCTGSGCTKCNLPGSDANINCQDNFGVAQDRDYYYSANSASWYKFDKLVNKAYQTPKYMAPIGEYYPFVSVLICKFVGNPAYMPPWP